ncbi:MAG: hypothetical protein QF491_10695, partial [Alphaproteobacteria bacterium]|nr:hypothetical protein [Alphaproteobacteria bacterium]
ALGLSLRAVAGIERDDHRIECHYQHWRGERRLLQTTACWLNQYAAHFGVAPRVQPAIANYPFISKSKIRWGREDEVQLARGRYGVRWFAIGRLTCFGFITLYGRDDTTARPNHLLKGFYCQEGGLDGERRLTVLRAIGYEHEHFGFPARPPVDAEVLDHDPRTADR